MTAPRQRISALHSEESVQKEPFEVIIMLMLPGLQNCNKEAFNGHCRRDNIFTIFNLKK